jgi:hypothetical protein
MNYLKIRMNIKLLRKLLDKSYNNPSNFIIVKNENNGFNELIIKHDFSKNMSIITILPSSNWREIKRHIEKKLNKHNKIDDCGICYEKMENPVSCSKCANNMCANCYINIFKIGKGVITCPHCRYSYGEKMDDYLIELSIYEIKQKLLKKN